MHGTTRRRTSRSALILLAASLAVPAVAVAQDGTPVVRRAVPVAVTAPAAFQRAVERGTRTADGSPGASYWQNWSKYDIDASLDPETGRLEGVATIRYANRSPYALNALVLHLHQNIHKAGAARHEPLEVTGGVELGRVAVGGVDLEAREELAAGAGYDVEGTLMTLRPPEAVAAGDSVTLTIEWSTVLPQNGAGRMGHSEREMYFVAYWYPKMAVFDDLVGWDAQPYLGGAEFYDDFGDFTVDLTVPAGWTLMGTGALLNPGDVFSTRTQERLRQAAESDEKVVVATAEELERREVTTGGSGGWLTYRFAADSVRDFAWTTSRVQRWDATSAAVPDRDGDGADDRVLIHSFWREGRAPLWAEQWRYAKQSVEHHSRYTGLTYPWPHMTSVEGADIIGGGMEFPMLTLIGPYTGRAETDLFNVTSHEIAHMWVPMMVGVNEKRYAWMDEGSTTFLEDESRMAIWPGVDHHLLEAQGFRSVAIAGLEQPLMRHGDWYEPGPGYGVASYSKPATLMVALRESIMDRDAWEEAYRAFLSEWAYKHPTPWDFFNTFERFAGEDLDWFWTPYYFETWSLDQSVQDVRRRNDGSWVVRIEDKGHAFFPTRVRIFTSGEGILERSIGLDHWLGGATEASIELPASVGTVNRVEINPSGYAPDIDRSNDFWPRS